MDAETIEHVEKPKKAGCKAGNEEDIELKDRA